MNSDKAQTDSNSSAQVIPQAAGPHQHQPSRFSRRSLIQIAIVVLVIIACVGGYLYYNHQNQKNGPKPVNDVKTYSNLTSYSVGNPTSGQGLGFSLPADFSKVVPKVKVSSNQQLFYEQSSKSSRPLTIGGAVASYSPELNPLPASVIQTYNSNLASSNQAFIKGQSSFAISLLQPNFVKQTITIQSLKPFTNSHIKSGAWIADFTVSTGKPPQSIYQGQMVYTMTANTTYKFMFYTATYNWAPNQSTWTQVINSLKVGS